jgi:hypothetical protein
MVSWGVQCSATSIVPIFQREIMFKGVRESSWKMRAQGAAVMSNAR